MADRRRWRVLAVGTFAQAATSCFIYGAPMLLPALRASGSSLFAASVLTSAPIAGVLLALIAWGAAADRYGERVVIVSGVGACGVLVAVAAAVPGRVALAVLLAVAGAAGASVNAASGRLVMGWFPVTERGLAMGTRQTAQPLGVALAALGLPALAHADGVHHALLYPAALCVLAAASVALLAGDPPRATRGPGQPAARSPYRGSRQLVRIHVASACLVVPQFAVGTFTLVYLVQQRHWDPTVAGRLIFGFQLAGALGRIASGVWSDRVGSRLRPMRQLGVCSAAIMLALGLDAALHSVLVVVCFGVGAVITVADNGLAYTAVAELAGAHWAGRALGVQNTVQNVVALATAPVLAGVIGVSGYAVAFVAVAAVALLAVPMTPVRAEAGLEPAQPAGTRVDRASTGS